MWKIIDKSTGKTFVGPTGKTLDNLDDETKSRFEKKHERIGDLDNFKIVRLGPTTYNERREYFKGTSPELAEMFPNVAENYMLGKTGAVENIPGAIGDIASYIPRAGFAITNGIYDKIRNFDMFREKGEAPKGEGFNLGRRASDEGTGLIQSIGRSPALGGMGVAKVPAAIAGKVFNLGRNGIKALENKLAFTGADEAVANLPRGSKFLDKLPNVEKAGWTGAAFAGADEAMSNREPEAKDYAMGFTLGAGAEPLLAAIPMIARNIAPKVKKLLERADVDLDRAVASALWLGNTERIITKEEFAQFMSDPKNKKVFDETMDAITSGWNKSPFVTDRGKALEPLIEDASKKGEKVLEKEDALNKAFGTSVAESSNPTNMRLERQKAALKAKDFEPYHDKTIFKPGKHDLKEDAFPTEYPDARVFTAKPGKTKTDRYQSTLEFNVERHADKWDKLGSSFSTLKGKKRPMSEEEEAFLKKMEDELFRDNKILEKYDANKLIEKNRFLRDYNPFEKNDLFYVDADRLFKSTGAKGFSQDFLDAVGELTATARLQGEFAMNRMRSGLELKNSSAVERAFAYASGDNAEYAVAKKYKNAIDEFADTLSDYADNSIAGARRTNSKGENYQVQPERMKKYAFSYLNKVQDVLRKKGALTAKDVTGLYGDAVMVNDKVVQDAIVKMLRRLGIDKETLASFEEEAREYTMMRKARAKLRKNAVDEANPFKGTRASWLYPQEGVNTKNIMFRNANRGIDQLKRDYPESVKYNLGVINKLGIPVRGSIYSKVRQDKE